jgi:hypothetical protein
VGMREATHKAMKSIFMTLRALALRNSSFTLQCHTINFAQFAHPY